MIDSLLTRGKNLHDCVISLRGEVWTHTTSLIPPLFNEVSVPSHERERSCICVFQLFTSNTLRTANCVSVIDVTPFYLIMELFRRFYATNRTYLTWK